MTWVAWGRPTQSRFLWWTHRHYAFAKAWLLVLLTYEIYRLVAWWEDEPLKRKLGHCFPHVCDCRRPNVEQKA